MPILQRPASDPIDDLVPGLSDLVFSDWLTEVRHSRIPGLPPDEYNLRLSLRPEAMAGYQPSAEACGRAVDQVLARIRDAGFRVLDFGSDITVTPGRETFTFGGKLLHRDPDLWQTDIQLTLARRPVR
jgi:hypothetical protein